MVALIFGLLRRHLSPLDAEAFSHSNPFPAIDGSSSVIPLLVAFVNVLNFHHHVRTRVDVWH